MASLRNIYGQFGHNGPMLTKHGTKCIMTVWVHQAGNRVSKLSIWCPMVIKASQEHEGLLYRLNRMAGVLPPNDFMTTKVRFML